METTLQTIRFIKKKCDEFNLKTFQPDYNIISIKYKAPYFIDTIVGMDRIKFRIWLHKDLKEGTYSTSEYTLGIVSEEGRTYLQFSCSRNQFDKKKYGERTAYLEKILRILNEAYYEIGELFSS